VASFEFPKRLPKEWIEDIERYSKVGSEVHGLKIVGRDKRGIIVHVGGDSFKILHDGKNTNNFGYETIGSTTHALEGHIIGSVFTMGVEAGRVADSITVALRWKTTAWTGKLKCAIYLHSDLSLKGATEERTIALTDTATWYTFNFADPKPNLTASTDYVLVAWAEETAGAAYIVYDSGDTNQGHYATKTYDGNFPDPLNPTHNNYKYSIYCTYTAGGAPTYINVSDSGVGADQLYSLSATLTLAESGSGIDGLGMQADLPLSDSGVGSDALQSIDMPLADSGVGAETLDMQGQLALADSGSGLDAPSLQAQLQLGDSGSGTDVLSQLQAQLPITDTGLGAESFGLQGSLILADVGNGVDSPSLLAQLSLADSAVGSDLLSLLTQLLLSDSGLGAESIDINIGEIIKAFLDSGVGTDSLSLLAQLLLADSGLGTESVYAGVPKVTKLFLIIGDLAIQLAGS
jgi:hypothetical protein